MRLWLLGLLLLAECIPFNQTPDTITVKHKFYSTTFDLTKHYPLVVKYYLVAVWLPSVS
jgi:hypothetical protein